jgi:hypothetical protein
MNESTTHETTALEKVQSYSPEQLFGSKSADVIIAEIRKEALSFAPDLTTDASRKQIASVAAKVAKAKVAIDKIGKQLVDPIKAQAKVIDAERKHYKDELDALKEEVRSPLTEWEHEQNRIEEGRKQTCFELEQCCTTTNATTGDVLPVDRLQQQLDTLRDFNLETADLGPYAEKAEAIIQRGIVTVEAAIKTRKVLDQHEAEEAKANAETPEQRVEREREIAHKAAQAERERIESEAKRKTAEEEARSQDEQHRRQVKNEAWKDISLLFPHGEAGVIAKTLINAIEAGKVRHVCIQF